MALVVGTNSYLDAATADTYFADALHAASWDAATSDTKDKSLVTATRMIDRQRFAGAKTDPAQALEFPRTGLMYADGTEVPSDSVPQEVIDATAELALALIENANIQTQADTGSNTKRVRAGSAEIEFFRPTTGGRFPTIVQELLRDFLTSGAVRAFASGTDVDSEIEDYDLNTGF